MSYNPYLIAQTTPIYAIALKRWDSNVFQGQNTADSTAL